MKGLWGSDFHANGPVSFGPICGLQRALGTVADRLASLVGCTSRSVAAQLGLGDGPSLRRTYLQCGRVGWFDLVTTFQHSFIIVTVPHL
jgi:hypothetical protein